MKYIKKLSDSGKKDFNYVGGKAANLAEMISAGLPVPGGYVLTTEAYRKYVELNGINKRIEGYLEREDLDSDDAAEKISFEIKRMFYEGDFPDEIKRELDSIKSFFDQEDVSVRSSATAEDLPGISFAGQYSSFLSVRGEEVYESIKKCWASLWNTRAISYRNKLKMNSTDIGHAVLIQRMIESEKSGILFTANPINGRRDQALINSSFGIGEAIVSGEVTPDQWVVEKDSGLIVEEKPGCKEKMTVRSAKGVSTINVPEELKDSLTLNREEIKELMKLAISAEKYFNSPQDIEWAYKDGEFYLVQSRPVTALYPMAPKGEKDKGFRVYLNINLYSQAMKEPFTPMGEDVIKSMITGIIDRYGKRKYKGERLWWYKNIGGRLFVDMTELLRNEKKWEELLNNPNDKDPVTSRALVQVLERNREDVLDGSSDLKYLKKFNPRVARFILKTIRRYMTGIISPEKARVKAISLGDSIIQRLEKEKETLSGTEERLSFIEKNSWALFMEGFGIVFYVAVSSTYIDKAKKIIEKHLGDSGVAALRKVEKAVPYSATTDMGMEILNLAEKLHSKDKKAEEGDPDIKEFLKKYGHRSSIELDLGVPDWREDPAYLVDLVSSYIEGSSYIEARERFEKSREEAEEAILTIRDMLNEKGRKKEARKTVKMLRGFRDMFGIREQSKFFITKALSIFRETLYEVGEELVLEGRLSDKKDVFYLKREDIRSKKNLDKTVELNRSEYEAELRRNAPRIITSTGESIYAPVEESSEGAIIGVPVSPGVYEGVVKILKTPEEGYRLNKGDILVTSGTNPSWTPMFLKIGALVMETGGPISHGSVVAREYGVPAVAGIPGATEFLRDGEKIRVNGETGHLEILDGNFSVEKAS